MAAEKEKPNYKVVADNRRARYDYEIGETFEAGLMLTGQQQSGDHQIAGRVLQLVRECPQGRPKPVSFQASGQADDLGTYRQRGDWC